MGTLATNCQVENTKSIPSAMPSAAPTLQVSESVDEAVSPALVVAAPRPEPASHAPVREPDPSIVAALAQRDPEVQMLHRLVQLERRAIELAERRIATLERLRRQGADNEHLLFDAEVQLGRWRGSLLRHTGELQKLLAVRGPEPVARVRAADAERRRA